MLMLKIIRLVLGMVLTMISIAFLIQGGLSRYAKLGIPPAPDWKLIGLGVAMLAGGLILIRPLPWRRR